MALPSVQAQTYTVLADFSGRDGAFPEAGVMLDAAGNLYGTARVGGMFKRGVVYKLDAAGKETVLYDFCSQTNCIDGANPTSAVELDSSTGNLYGTTYFGGASNSGVVYKLDAAGKETVLYSFCSEANCMDGALPGAGVVRDFAGNLYGTTDFGGAGNAGVVYKLDGTGKETVLYSFCSLTNCIDGAYPYAGVIRDSAGNLYGTTESGGTSASSAGLVYKLDMSGKETVIYNFCSQPSCGDGANPYAGLIRDTAGNLYGTAEIGGAENGGVVFKLDTMGNETVLYSFCSRANCSDGANPQAGVVRDSAGNLYGVTYFGGVPRYYGGIPNHGVVYELDTGGALTILHTFSFRDGEFPVGSLARDSAGNTYGATFLGGTRNGGVIFRLTP